MPKGSIEPIPAGVAPPAPAVVAPAAAIEPIPARLLPQQPPPSKPPADDVPVDPIAELSVSAHWKRRFRLIDKAGGPKLPEFKRLSIGERLSVQFSLLGFLVGPIYYLFKGMWKKGLALFAVCVAALVAIELMLELGGFAHAARALEKSGGFAVGGVFAVRAHIDYYKKMVLGDRGWW